MPTRKIRDVDFTQERAGSIASAIQLADTANTAAAAVTNWSVQTSSFVAVKNRSYFCNTASGSIKAMLPNTSSLSIGDFVTFSDIAGTWSTNSLLITQDVNANTITAPTINGNNFGHRISTRNGSITLTYTGSNTRGFVVTESANTANVLTVDPTSLPFVPDLGDAYGGGYYAGTISTSNNGVATHRLVVAPVSTGEIPADRGSTFNVGWGGPNSRIDGPNTSAQLSAGLGPSWLFGVAARWAEGLVIGGYSDWYLPAIDELEVIYYNFKPTGATNNTNIGNNSYSVPQRFGSSNNYTAGTPAQTSITIFKGGNAEAFKTDYGYWTSSTNQGQQYYLSFVNGQNAPIAMENYGQRSRAIRRIPI